MRTKIVLLLVALVAIVSVSFAATARPVAASAANLQAAAKCTDATMLTAVGKDLTDFGKTLKDFDPTSDKGVAANILSIAVLRQKYEDMEKVPAECQGVQLYMIVALANYGDALSLIVAAKADPDNAKTYTDAVKPQIERANKILGLLTGEIGGASAPAATAAK